MAQPANKRIRLGDKLYDQCLSGKCTDVLLTVGSAPGQTRIGVHKNVLVASSSVFATMFEERWQPGQTVTIPPDCSLEAVHLFMKRNSKPTQTKGFRNTSHSPNIENAYLQQRSQTATDIGQDSERSALGKKNMTLPDDPGAPLGERPKRGRPKKTAKE